MVIIINIISYYSILLLHFVPSLLWCCWLRSRKGIWNVKSCAQKNHSSSFGVIL